MTKTYLRMNLFNYLKKNSLTLHDQVDLEFDEPVHDVLQGCAADYVELFLVSLTGNQLTEGLVCCYRRIKLKGSEDYQWLVCEHKGWA